MMVILCITLLAVIVVDSFFFVSINRMIKRVSGMWMMTTLLMTLEWNLLIMVVMNHVLPVMLPRLGIYPFNFFLLYYTEIRITVFDNFGISSVLVNKQHMF